MASRAHFMEDDSLQVVAVVVTLSVQPHFLGCTSLAGRLFPGPSALLPRTLAYGVSPTAHLADFRFGD